MRDTESDEAEFAFWKRVVRYRWRTIAAAVVLAPMLAVGATLLLTPGYSASVELTVSDGGGAADREFLDGSTVRDAVTRELGFVPDVSVTGTEGQSLIAVSADGETPEQVVLVANTYADVAIAERIRTIGEERAATQAMFERRIADVDARRATATADQRLSLDLQRAAYEESAAAARTAPSPPIPVVVDPAALSDATGPDLLTVAAGAAVIGLFAGLAATGIAEHGDLRVRTADAAGDALAAPPLGSVPGAEETGWAVRWWRSFLRLRRSGSAAEPGSATADAVGLVRQRLHSRGRIKPHGALSVCAVDPRDAGHAVAVAVDLARSVARSGRSVLLLSANLRGGDGCLARLHLYSEGPGLSYLLAGADPKRAVQATMTEGMSVVPAGAGTESPYDDLQSERFGTVLAELRLASDLLLVVTPPLTEHPDGLAVAEVVDSRVAVVGPNARRPLLEQGLHDLERNGITLDGFVFAGRART